MFKVKIELYDIVRLVRTHKRTAERGNMNVTGCDSRVLAPRVDHEPLPSILSRAVKRSLNP